MILCQIRRAPSGGEVRPTLTLCKSTVFMMEPWKKVTVVKCLLISPSSSRPGGVLPKSKMKLYHAFCTNRVFFLKKALKLLKLLTCLDKLNLEVPCCHCCLLSSSAVSARLKFVRKRLECAALDCAEKYFTYLYDFRIKHSKE